MLRIYGNLLSNHIYGPITTTTGTVYSYTTKTSAFGKGLEGTQHIPSTSFMKALVFLLPINAALFKISLFAEASPRIGLVSDPLPLWVGTGHKTNHQFYILYTDVAELALSKCVETNEGKMKMYTNSIHPTSKEYLVTYHYDLLEECSSGSSR